MSLQIGGRLVSVKLRTTDWQTQIEQEMALCTSNTGALFNTISNSLLGDDFNLAAMDFDSDGKIWNKNHCLSVSDRLIDWSQR